MAKGQTSRAYSPPKLVVPREEAVRKIKEQIEIGRSIRDQKMFSMADLESALERRAQWLEDNIEILTRLIDNPFFEEEYHMAFSLDMDSAITFTLKEKYFRDDINEQIGRLESLLERLKLIPEATAEELIERKIVEESIRQEQPGEIQSMEAQLREALTREVKPREELPKEKPLIEKPPKEAPSKEVSHRRESDREDLPPTISLNQSQLPGGSILLIHGRDEAMKGTLLTFIENLGLRTLILHEQPDGGRSIMENCGESSHIHFAIIILAPDDIAAPRSRPKERQAHVSQNVIFEFGYFVGKLGKGRVCAIYKEGVEIPTDFPGVVYIPMDSRGGWRLLVAKEIKQAGIDIDLNKAI